MATMTVEIDLEAYELLCRHRRDGESLSDAIKAQFRSNYSVARFSGRMGSIRISKSALRAMERQVENRRLNPVRAARLES